MKKKKRNLRDSEKKEFLSNDLTERMIRVEQRVSAHFGKPVSYNQTEYYNSMTKKQKEEYENYLAKKKKKKYLFSGFFILPLFALFLFKFRITGGVISENIGSGNLTLVNILMISVVFFVVILILLSKRKESRYDRMLEKHYSVLHNVLSGKIPNKKYAI